MKKADLKLYIDSDLLEWLRKESKTQHRSVSYVVRGILREVMEGSK